MPDGLVAVFMFQPIAIRVVDDAPQRGIKVRRRGMDQLARPAASRFTADKEGTKGRRRSGKDARRVGGPLLRRSSDPRRAPAMTNIAYSLAKLLLAENAKWFTI
ncbi:MAG: hypothetical protein ACRELG_23665 [Gemmataceae bacterium]